MSIEVLKKELAGLAETERSNIIAYLVALQDGEDNNYRAALTRKIDESDPRRWLTLEEFDRRLTTDKD